MKVPVLMKRSNKVKMMDDRYAKILVKANYATYAPEEDQTYKTRQLKAEDLETADLPKKRGRPKKEKEPEIQEEESETQED